MNNKIKNLAVLAIMIISTFTGLLILTVPTASAAVVATGDTYAPDGTGNWTINQTTVYRNNTIYLWGNISCSNNGTLTLDNTTVYIQTNVTWNTTWQIGFYDDILPAAPGLYIINSKILTNVTTAGIDFKVSHDFTAIHSVMNMRDGEMTQRGISNPIRYGRIVFDSNYIIMRSAQGTTSELMDADHALSVNATNNYFVGNETCKDGDLNLFGVGVGAPGSHNQYVNLQNNTYITNGTESYVILRYAADIEAWNEWGNVQFESEINGADVSFYEPIHISLVDINGAYLNTPVTIKRQGTGTYHNTTTNTTFWIYSGNKTNAPTLDRYFTEQNLLYEITFPAYPTTTGLKIINSTCARFHYAGTNFRHSPKKYDRHQYNITCHEGVNYFNFPEWNGSTPTMIRIDDLRNNGGNLNPVNQSRDLQDINYFLNGTINNRTADNNGLGWKITFFQNEGHDPVHYVRLAFHNTIMQNTEATYSNAYRDGLVEITTHWASHNYKTYEENFSESWTDLNYSLAFASANMTYGYNMPGGGYAGSAFPNEAHDGESIDVLVNENFVWVSTGIGEDGTGPDFNGTKTLFPIAMGGAYFHGYLSAINYAPHPAFHFADVAYSTWEGAQGASGGEQKSEDTINESRTEQYFVFGHHVGNHLRDHEVGHPNGSGPWNATKNAAWGSYLDQIQTFYGLRPMTMTEYYMYTQMRPLVAYSRIDADEYRIDFAACNSSYRKDWYLNAVAGEDSVVLDETTGIIVYSSISGGQITWLAYGGHSYKISKLSTIRSQILLEEIDDGVLGVISLMFVLLIILVVGIVVSNVLGMAKGKKRRR